MKKDKDKKIYISKLINIFIVIFLIFIPSITFIIIFYINPNIDIYFDHFSTIQNDYSNYYLPSKVMFMSFIWSSVFFLCLGIGIMMFYPFIIRNKIKHPVIKNIFITATIGTFLIALILIATAEYNYSTFYTLYKFIGSHNIENNSDSTYGFEFASNYQLKQNYEWSGEALTWWMCLIQILVLIISFSIFNSTLNNENVGASEESTMIITSKKNMDQSKITVLLNKISINNDKNLIVWMLIVSIIIFMPQLAYVVALSIPSGKISSLLNWTFIAPNLVELNGLELLNIEKSYFAIANLPIIASSFLFGTISIFTLIYIKGIKINRNFFILQFILLLIEMLTIIALNTYSIHEINNITEIWNQNDVAEILQKSHNEGELDSRLILLFGNDVWKGQTTINYLWLGGIQYISQTVILTSFTIVVFIILGTKIWKKFEKS